MEKKNISGKNISRRDFLKAAGSAAVTAGMAAGCAGGSRNGGQHEGTPGEMTVRTNHVTGDKVGLLGYGCMRWPMTAGDDGKEIIDQEQVNRLVDRALECGVNYFDTSPVYCQGLSEKATAIALSRHPRSSYYLATKLSNFSNWSTENSMLMYRKSFENLQTDYIDYYLLHSVGGGGISHFNARYVDNGMTDFLVKEREAGRIRNLGFSFHGDMESFDYVLGLHDKVRWDFVQIQMNYVDWKHASGDNVNAEYLYGELAGRGIQAVIMEPLLGGRLSRVPEHIATRLKERDPYRSIASWAFRFAGSFPEVLTVLSGMTYMEHLEENISTYSPLETLTDEDLDFLEETAVLMLQYPTIPCNDCKYCMPCPYGIDIPAVLLHYNKCVNEGNIAQDSSAEGYRKARRAYLVGYSRAVEKVRQADHCIGCKQCIPHCPQSINIPHELHRIARYVEDLKRAMPGM